LEDRVEQMELKISKNLGNFGAWVLSIIEALSTNDVRSVKERDTATFPFFESQYEN